MKQLTQHLLLLTAGIVLTAAVFVAIDSADTSEHPDLPRVRSTSSPHAKAEAKKDRWEYMFNTMRDPVTNDIPKNIRARELKHADRMPKAYKGIKKTQAVNYDYVEAGPMDMGGRTRALAIDVANTNVVIAGGASGGMWKSTDKGVTWESKSPPSQHQSVTWVAQDTREGHTNKWYYSTGEFNGQTAADRGFRAFYYGHGLYKSTDNGESWSAIDISIQDNNPQSFDNPFDFVSKVVVHPQNGNIYAAANATGIFRSTDEGETWEVVLGGLNEHYDNDVEINTEGKILAMLSSTGSSDTQTFDPGLYLSEDSGDTWSKINVADMPANHSRTLIAFSQSNPNVAYLMLRAINTNTSKPDDVRLYKVNIQNGTAEDRTGNLPYYVEYNGESPLQEGLLLTQGDYNMALAVKPDDENFVIIGATSMFRSNDGFATAESDERYAWIGGYNAYTRPNSLHPDIHVFAWDPENPNALWVGHDGGISYTSNIADESYAEYFQWEDKNNAYVTTQYYSVTFGEGEGDRRILGGMQDNGSPYFTFDPETNSASSSEDISTGDGYLSYFTPSYAFVTSQYGRVIRYKTDVDGRPISDLWSVVAPVGAINRQFLNPYVVNPDDDNTMYYVENNRIWRNTSISSIDYYQNETALGWEVMSAIQAPNGYSISELELSRVNPENTLLWGSSSYQFPPKFARAARANSTVSRYYETDLPGAADGAYVIDIVLNPENGRESLTLLSNYNVEGIYHSDDNGINFTLVEGNLKGTEDAPGPSIRCGAILPTATGTTYFVGTSTGLYATDNLDGDNTVWVHQAPELIGNVVVAAVDVRTTDHWILVGTHGRGAFVGGPSGTVSVEDDPASPQGFELTQNYPNPFNPATRINFTLPEAGSVKVSVFAQNGELVDEITNTTYSAGTHTLNYNASHLASGVYLYRLTSGTYTESKQMVLLK